jgi:type II secretory ATPase GspE/PulE/Tfp pilus assembly ATPase PilB-like protein
VRAFLRQDPDVIIVGEIRDEETAREAFRAALTGHLVLSTLHANSAVESIGRLLDLGLEPYQVSQTLLGTLSQRLVRKLCGACRVKTTFPVSRLLPNAYDTLQSLVEDAPLDLELAEPGKGCGKCSDGHVGRTVVAEVLVLDEVAREQIHQRAANSAIVGAAKKQGFQTMMDHALGLVLQGVTSLLEAEAVVGPMTMPDAA